MSFSSPHSRGKLQALIGRMAAETHLWGQMRIQTELARLGFQVSAQDIYASALQPGPNRDVSRSASMPKIGAKPVLGWLHLIYCTAG
jgi:hypothetical protein